MLTSYRSGAKDCAQVQGADPGYRQLQSGPHTHTRTHTLTAGSRRPASHSSFLQRDKTYAGSAVLLPTSTQAAT